MYAPQLKKIKQKKEICTKHFFIQNKYIYLEKIFFLKLLCGACVFLIKKIFQKKIMIVTLL